MNFCKDCKWCKIQLFYGGGLSEAGKQEYYLAYLANALCVHPNAPLSLVSGEPDSLCSEQRKLPYTDNETRCGMEGNWWEPKEDEHERR